MSFTKLKVSDQFLTRFRSTVTILFFFFNHYTRPPLEFGKRRSRRADLSLKLSLPSQPWAIQIRLQVSLVFFLEPTKPRQAQQNFHYSNLSIHPGWEIQTKGCLFDSHIWLCIFDIVILIAKKQPPIYFVIFSEFKKGYASSFTGSNFPKFTTFIIIIVWSGTIFLLSTSKYWMSYL